MAAQQWGWRGPGGARSAMKIPATWTGDPVLRTNTENTHENANTNTNTKNTENS